MLQKTLLATIIVCALSAPSAMADPIGVNIDSSGVSTNIPNNVPGAIGSILDTLMPNQNARGMRNGLPGTSMDSFVYQAGPSAELIYGDEGVDDIPPYFEFTKEHRINAGIFGQRSAGLTTGHGSYLPDAWGGDEWVKGPEFDRSGPNNGIPPGGGGGINIGLGNGTNINIGPNGGSLTSGGLNVNAGPGGVSGSLNTPLGNITGSAGDFGF